MNSKRLLLFPLMTALVLSVLASDKPSASGVIHFDHQKVDALFASGGTLLATNNFKVMALRRDRPGEVEIHDADTDVVYVLEGSATMVTGGKATHLRTTGPGEARGKSIEGGEEQQLTKGDVLVIPNRVPHWFKEVKAPFLYYVVKVSR